MKKGYRSGAGRGSILPPPDEWRPSLRALPLDHTTGEIVVGETRRALQPQEQVALSVLLVRDWVSTDAFLDAFYGLYLDMPDTGISVVRVVISNLRRKLQGSGGMIVTLYRAGYRLDRPANDNHANGRSAA